MFNIGPWELGLILVVALIVVGPGKLPEVAKSIGKGINEFKKVTNGYKKDFQEALNDIEKTVKDEEKASAAVTPGDSISDVASKFDSVIAENQSEPAKLKDSDPE